jgi:hypothetical protein
MRLILLPVLAATAGGCVAQTALDVVTLPVKVAAAGVDAVTTSQAEADRKRGRQIRKRDECMGREERVARKEKREPDYLRCEERSKA